MKDKEFTNPILLEEVRKVMFSLKRGKHLAGSSVG